MIYRNQNIEPTLNLRPLYTFTSPEHLYITCTLCGNLPWTCAPCTPVPPVHLYFTCTLCGNLPWTCAPCTPPSSSSPRRWGRRCRAAPRAARAATRRRWSWPAWARSPPATCAQLVRDIGRMLDIRIILEHNLQKILVNVQLLDTQVLYHIWS